MSLISPTGTPACPEKPPATPSYLPTLVANGILFGALTYFFGPLPALAATCLSYEATDGIIGDAVSSIWSRVHPAVSTPEKTPPPEKPQPKPASLAVQPKKEEIPPAQPEHPPLLPAPRIPTPPPAVKVDLPEAPDATGRKDLPESAAVPPPLAKREDDTAGHQAPPQPVALVTPPPPSKMDEMAAASRSTAQIPPPAAKPVETAAQSPSQVVVTPPPPSKMDETAAASRSTAQIPPPPPQSAVLGTPPPPALPKPDDTAASSVKPPVVPLPKVPKKPAAVKHPAPPKKPWWSGWSLSSLFSAPKLDPIPADAHFLGEECAALPPIGIKNDDGACCFLAALMQLILTDPILEQALWEEGKAEGPTKEIGQFLHHYRDCQKRGEKSCSGISAIRTTLQRLDPGTLWTYGQHDPHEALNCIMREPHLLDRLPAEFFTTSTLLRHWEFGSKTRRPLVDDPDFRQIPDTSQWVSRDTHGDTASRGDVLIDLRPESKGQPLEKLITNDERIGNRPYHTVDETGTIQDTIQYLHSQIQWREAPRRLTVSLKRFFTVMVPATKPGAKPTAKLFRINDPVNVSERMTLDASYFQDKAAHDYELMAFEVHIGGLVGGHHYSYVKKIDSDKKVHYYCTNDSSAYEIAQADFMTAACSPAAYMLVFDKRS
jgi:hypothetical protein